MKITFSNAKETTKYFTEFVHLLQMFKRVYHK